MNRQDRQTELEAMSKDEINELVCKIIHPDCSFVEFAELHITGIFQQPMFVIEGCQPEKVPDYCNSPNDIMPIAIENGIGTIKAGENWFAHDAEMEVDNIAYAEFTSTQTNPLRAICIVLILKMESEN